MSHRKDGAKIDDDSDKIPTRDVGPGISQVPVVSCDAINKTAINSPQLETKANTINNKPGNKDLTNNKLLNNQRLASSTTPTSPQQRYTSMINIPISATSTPNVATTPLPLPRKTSTPTPNSGGKSSNATHPLVSSLQRRNSNSSSNSSTDVLPNVKSWKSGESPNGSPVRTNELSTPSSARRNNAKLTTISSPSSSKPEQPRGDCVETPTTPITNQQLQKNNCNKADNNANETENNQDEDANKSVSNTGDGTKEKRTDNSIWYEYGCV